MAKGVLVAVFERGRAAAAVCAAHFALLWLLIVAVPQAKPQLAPPAVVGQLVLYTAPPAPEPAPEVPKPPEPKPKPTPRPEPKPKPEPAPEPTPEPVALPEPVADAAPAAPTPRPEPIEAPSPVQAPPAPVTPPRADAAFLNNPPPQYPLVARRLQQQGRVVLDVYILADGSVGEVRVKHSSGFARLDEAALNAVRRWRYVPAKRGDTPISVWYLQPIEFLLN